MRPTPREKVPPEDMGRGEQSPRPTCQCHGEPMHKNGLRDSGDIDWRCSVKNKIRVVEPRKAIYYKDPMGKNYRRRRNALIQRIAEKKQLITKLEADLNGLRSP